jgi:hypothetical protein
MSKRARIIDKNPLSQTDSVLDSFQQYSKPASQQVEKSTRQEVETTESDQPIAKEQSPPPAVEEAKPSRKSTRQKVEKLTSQQAALSESEPNNLSGSQEVDKPVIKKATFQLSEAVLQQLDTFHLQLQLELGKANAPYKEVIVEEAIAQLLGQASGDRAKLIEALRQRQQRRD